MPAHLRWHLQHEHPSIHLPPRIQFRVAGGAEPTPAAIGQEARQGRHSVTRLTQRDTRPFTFTAAANLEPPINLTPLTVFGPWEEARVPGEKPHRHGENIQTPARGKKVCAGAWKMILFDRILYETAGTLISAFKPFVYLEVWIWSLAVLTWWPRMSALMQTSHVCLSNINNINPSCASVCIWLR